MNKQLPTQGTRTFEELRQTNEHGAEYWSTRDLQAMLGYYSQWRRFEDAVKRAMTSCETSGNNPEHHFAGAGKMVDLGSGSQREVEDYHLSRFACYLIAQNGDPRKPEIANAQKYFAIQARRQELGDQAAADMERLELRKQTSEEFKALSGAAQDAGVQSKMFGVFHDAGYKGLYPVAFTAFTAVWIAAHTVRLWKNLIVLPVCSCSGISVSAAICGAGTVIRTTIATMAAACLPGSPSWSSFGLFSPRLPAVRRHA